MTIYAAYKGETFLIADTIDRVAKFLNVSAETVRWHTCPSAIKRKSKERNGLVIIKFEEENEC